LISFGFITVREAQELSYVTEIAKRSSHHGITVYRFTPHSIDPSTENVHGYKYNDSSLQWEKAIFRIPDYLYDRCFYGSDDASKKAQPIMNWLKNNPNTTFLGHGLPNKWNIYQALKKDSELAFYLPHTEEATSSTNILKKLVKEKQILLKPVSGSMGNGIIGLFINQNKIETITHHGRNADKNVFTSKSAIINWLNKLLATNSYLYQPLLSLQDQDNRPYDIRILLQKNEDGKWHELGRGIRKGQQGSLISNISGGAEIIAFNEWIKTFTANERLLLLENIHTIVNFLPRILEMNFQPMFEIGVDLGMASDGSVWILDTNSKPGRKVVLKTNPAKNEDIYTAPLLYCKFLDQLKENVKRS